MRGIVILASCEYYFIRIHENLVQHPRNNISISYLKPMGGQNHKEMIERNKRIYRLLKIVNLTLEQKVE